VEVERASRQLRDVHQELKDRGAPAMLTGELPAPAGEPPYRVLGNRRLNGCDVAGTERGEELADARRVGMLRHVASVELARARLAVAAYHTRRYSCVCHRADCCWFVTAR